MLAEGVEVVQNLLEHSLNDNDGLAEQYCIRLKSNDLVDLDAPVDRKKQAFFSG